MHAFSSTRCSRRAVFAQLAGRTALILVVAMSSASRAAAHEILMTYVSHAVRVVVGPVNIDIHVELTFNEIISLVERRRIDQDENGVMQQGEITTYLEELAPTLSHSMALTIAGRPVDVFSLYDPQIDLLGVDTVTPAHHTLRVSLFARTPASFAVGQEIVLRDRLWADAPALSSFQASGVDGIHVEAASPKRSLSDSSAEASDRYIHIVRVAHDD